MSDDELRMAPELPVELHANGEKVAVLMCSPYNLDDLAVGHLVGRGMLTDRATLMSVGACADLRLATVIAPDGIHQDRYGLGVVVSSGCGSGPVFRTEASLPLLEGGPCIPLGELQLLARYMFDMAELYREIGGMHCAALFVADTATGAAAEGLPAGHIVVREDVGRHNAVDKVIGYAFRNGWPLEQAVILTSGRIAADMILKAIAAGVRLLVSRSIPTSTAYELAKATGLTLVGRIEKSRPVLYCSPERVGGQTPAAGPGGG